MSITKKEESTDKIEAYGNITIKPGVCKSESMRGCEGVHTRARAHVSARVQRRKCEVREHEGASKCVCKNTS